MPGIKKQEIKSVLIKNMIQIEEFETKKTKKR